MAGSIPRRNLLQAAAAAVALSACTPAPDPTPASVSASAGPTRHFAFGTPVRPISLDPAVTSDAESWRVTRQILEGLLFTDPLTGAPAPGLAVSWTVAEDGLSYSFTLREGVQFHDGTLFDATAVKANFDRWFAFAPALRAANPGMAFTSVFKAHKDQADLSTFRSCTVVSQHVVKISLTQRHTGFLQALTSPAFGISSPTALHEGTADLEEVETSQGTASAYSQHPVGTGPFRFAGWGEDRVTLESFPGYWGDRGQISTVEFVVYDQAQARLQALKDGRIDAYDLVTIGDITTLVRGGYQVIRRDPFSVLYLGMNQAIPVLQKEKVRRAIAMAVDREALVSKFFIDDTGLASQFVPPKLSGFNNSVTFPSFSPEQSRRLLAEAGYKGEEIRFYYPLDVTRPYLPTPEKVYAELSAQLVRVGLNIKPVPIDWSEGYLERVTTPGDHGLHLLGYNGGYADPDSFLSPLFGAKTGEFGYFDPQLFTKIDRARSLPEGSDRVEAYQSINAQLSRTIPAVPIAYPISAVAASDRVESYPSSPVLDEVFHRIRLKN